ncbi:polysaccharide deacetylase family protein [Paenibacillus turpanensis]|uniref:polysaccharide deacetylase family protein n=1 Tax=Paenibacillus turpanensis TaxID=2689078 RepID=UPI00140BCD29|nr:polysaccharide deacetylase family protein [Paenibacillus turpanensis]
MLWVRKYGKLLVKLILIGVLIGLIGAGGYAAYYFYPPHYSGRVTVLEYHDISYDKGEYSITPELFRAQLELLKGNGAHFITSDQFEAFMKGEAEIPDDAMLVTFDDGFASYAQTALPILEELEIPSVQFLITGYAYQSKKTDKFLTTTQIQAILQHNDEAGPAKAEFGCHTHASHIFNDGKGILAQPIHMNGKQETVEEYHKRVRDDLVRCQSELQKLYTGAGRRPTAAAHMLAYPFGSYDPQSLEVYQSAGIQYAFTGEPRLVRQDDAALLIPRIHAGVPQATPYRLQYWVKRGISRAAAQ